MALPKQHRLRHFKEFAQVYRHGRRAKSPHLSVRVLDAVDPALARESAQPFDLQPQTQQPPRCGISVSQKVSKQAVGRNLWKRRIRAAFQQLLPRLHPGITVVITAHPTVQQCDYRQILQELEQLLMQLEVIDGHS
ncbi:Ribonuclease P protein component [Halomicronema hongdechloris C2206]|uniref:Ribonuclease P protein component n=1 Tax=Halomicronema hongdechloris C2206 TaxID=1641165 RepID=A0A1Z3HG85_9CYAN|nr:ribonuclease P protein component [Halomicronema hongdechloris]ASC69275.1 Ribonuclease P protein component [Halomicronema hongdechloris C2206]